MSNRTNAHDAWPSRLRCLLRQSGPRTSASDAWPSRLGSEHEQGRLLRQSVAHTSTCDAWPSRLRSAQEQGHMLRQSVARTSGCEAWPRVGEGFGSTISDQEQGIPRSKLRITSRDPLLQCTSSLWSPHLLDVCAQLPHPQATSRMDSRTEMSESCTPIRRVPAWLKPSRVNAEAAYQVVAHQERAIFHSCEVRNQRSQDTCILLGAIRCPFRAK